MKGICLNCGQRTNKLIRFTNLGLSMYYKRDMGENLCEDECYPKTK